MIKIFIDNEELDLDQGQIVTIKRSQNLNGVQNQYSFSNNFNAPLTSKNKRLLRINYLPNSKSKSMTEGYDCDIVFNGCIFLKRQKLKVQKENEKSIPLFIIFTDSFFIAKSKQFLVNDIDLGVTYDKSVLQFLSLNNSTSLIRTAPISAQNESNFVVIEEMPPLLNIVKLVEKIISGIGYSFYGSFFTEPKLNKYFCNANSSLYGIGGVPKFDGKLNVFQFLTSILKTFNAYIDVSDSGKSVGMFLWNDIENLKKNFIDYSQYYEKYTDYSFEGGLSKINTIEYSGSQPFYNSFFENNKSIIETSNYIKSDFGAGSLRLFADQELTPTFTLPLRPIGEQSTTSEVNIFKFEDANTQSTYYVGGAKFISPMKKAFSPNILEIFNDFHFDYVKNISLPTVANLQFRYDAIFLADLKMQNVFFIKNLSTYWLPIELNYSTKKDKINIKCLMIEKTKVDVPIVFDLNVSMGFLGVYKILDASPLYSSQNVSPQSIFTIHSFDATKNKIFITGNNNIRTQVIATPINIDISTSFILEFENVDPLNIIDSSDLLFSFTSQNGGVSRIAKINIQHNGQANYVSEFRMVVIPTVFETAPINFFKTFLNFAQKITTVKNVPLTLSPQTGSQENESTALSVFKMIKLTRAQALDISIDVAATHVFENNLVNGTSDIVFEYTIYRNGILVSRLFSASGNLPQGVNNRTISYDEKRSITIAGNADDEFTFMIGMITDTSGSTGKTFTTNTFNRLIWNVKSSEQL